MATATNSNSNGSSEGALVFVYGTLMQGEHNHRLLATEDAAYLGPCTTEPAFTMYHLGGFPAVAPEGDTAIRGELYVVGDATLAALDRLEGHPSFYLRTTIRLAGGSEVLAYVMPADRLAGDRWWRGTPDLIPSGDWRERDPR
jgi:gamma-glutamylcyclotransferase (GGCT)/AIG2-like uncharacterized protein YtfP